MSTDTDRAWGTGSVTAHGAKWRARLPLTHGRQSLGLFDTREEAAAVLTAALAQLANAPIDAPTLATWGEKTWMPTREVREGTLERDVSRWRLLVGRRSIGKLPLAEVSQLHVETWLASLHGAVQTRRNALSLLRQALAAATKLGGPIVGRPNAAAGVKVGRGAKQKGEKPAAKEPWTWLRLAEIETALAIDTVPLRSRIFWTCSIYSGLRPGELCGLRWDNVDFDRSVLCVRWSRGEAPKNGRPRDVPMLAPVREALLRWRDLYRAARVRSHLGLVFPARDGGYHADGYDAGWYEAVKGSPLARANFYDCRHTCASHLLQGSWAPTLIARPLRIEEVSEWLGHSDITVTQRYAHLCPDAIAGLVVKPAPALPVLELGRAAFGAGGVALLVPCPCAGTKASPCDWCCGSHRVTKRVREAMEDRGQKLLDACAVLDEHDCVARIDLIDERKVSGRLGVGVKCKVETLSDAILWLAEHEEEA